MNGAGNDFAVMDIRGQSVDLSALAVVLCKLTSADGLMAADVSETADFRLHFYNADGSRGEMCGNGARCLCRFAYENRIAGETMTVETDGGTLYGQRIDDSVYRIRLVEPGIIDLHRKGDIAYVELGTPGVPHALWEVPGLCWEDKEALRQQAKTLRFDPAFPKGANVNLYTRLDERTVRILTYERYVEDYTLACGTGSACVAVVLKEQGLLPGKRLTVCNPGGDLTIAFHEDALFLEGPTEINRIFEYE
jgi:diaminopimelate epimerase